MHIVRRRREKKIFFSSRSKPITNIFDAPDGREVAEGEKKHTDEKKTLLIHRQRECFSFSFPNSLPHTYKISSSSTELCFDFVRTIHD